MLFLTNRYPTEKFKDSDVGPFTFDLDDTDPGEILFFCRRNKKGVYSRVLWKDFFGELKKAGYKNLLFFIHGFNNLPEDVFKKTELLQKMADSKKAKEVLIVPFIWPCDNDFGIIKDYKDDQIAADRSGTSIMNALNKFLEWGKEPENMEIPCLKRINILAHSMGNRVLRRAVFEWKKYYQHQGVPQISRNTFLVAADIENESLEVGKEGEHLSDFSRNVVVYFANDDLALRGSKVANLANLIASRRLGHTGPENIDRCKKNVYSIDCDDINMDCSGDTKKILGHNYLGSDIFFNHMFECILYGRVRTENEQSRKLILR